MKAFSTILIVLVGASIARAVNPEEFKAHMMQIFTACKTSSGASDDDIAKLMMHSKPATHEGMCMFACVMDKMGIIKDGKLSKDGILAWEKSMKVPSIADQVMADCSTASSSDPCEAAAEIGHCFKQAAIKAGAMM